MIDPLKFFRTKPILLVRPPGMKVALPVADIRGKSKGRTLLVTAGVDGDEYTGIEAAYLLIEKHRNRNFAGRLIVLPIVNMHGFEAEQSKNSVDNKFPKYIFPGSPTGSESEQLIHWLTHTYAVEADAWLDLHSGAITESVLPHIWAQETGVRAVDDVSRAFWSSAGVPIVLEKGKAVLHKRILAERGCSYLLVDAGGRGERGASDVGRHLAWAELLMEQLGLIDAEEREIPSEAPRVFEYVEKVVAPYAGVYTPNMVGETIERGDDIGTCATFDATKVKHLRAPRSGTILWHKQTMAMREGDTLCAIAY